jgi:hypothetical protein
MVPTTTELRSEVPEWVRWQQVLGITCPCLPGGVGMRPRQAVSFSPVLAEVIVALRYGQLTRGSLLLLLQ